MKKELRKKFENVVNVLKNEGFNINLENVLTYNKYIWSLEDEVNKCSDIFSRITNRKCFDYKMIFNIFENNKFNELSLVLELSDNKEIHIFDNEQIAKKFQKENYLDNSIVANIPLPDNKIFQYLELY